MIFFLIKAYSLMVISLAIFESLLHKSIEELFYDDFTNKSTSLSNKIYTISVSFFFLTFKK